jgi:hypothetical protein
VDDDHIRRLTAEVLKEVRGGAEPGSARDLEGRVSALEAAVARLQAPTGPPAGGPAAVAAHHHTHPALRVLDVPGGSDRCVLEPDRPCVQSHACRILGH